MQDYDFAPGLLPAENKMQNQGLPGMANPGKRLCQQSRNRPENV